MRVLFVASECAPFIKTGGLADVVGAVPKALAKYNANVRILMPAYPALAGIASKGKMVLDLSSRFGSKAQIISVKAEGLELLLFDAPHLFDREGNPYTGPNGQDWPDNHLRFGGLAQAANAIAMGKLKTWKPDIVHAHDWQAGLVPAYLKLNGKKSPPCVMTIHNIAFQGRFPASVIKSLDLPRSGFVVDGYEYFGDVCFLKAGLVYADKLTTVSPTYARELMSPEFGMGLEGIIYNRKTDLVGILNGIDLDMWNPETDELINANYSAKASSAKSRNRRALAKRFRMNVSTKSPLFCVVSRLTEQKGLDLLLDALPHLVWRGAGLAVLGSGNRDLEKAFAEAADKYPGRVGVQIGYDEPLSHLMQAGADAILIPSRFEPCGLTQLYGLRYGTLPVVARTGGLADTVIDANNAGLVSGCATGFQFSPNSVSSLQDSIDRVCDTFADKKVWRSLMRSAMRHPVGWDRSAEDYINLYTTLAGTPQA